MSLLAFICLSAVAIDGDTLRCANSTQTIRLAGIDAPELAGHCRKTRVCAPGDAIAARDYVTGALALGPVTIQPIKIDLYGRLVASATIATGENLSCSILIAGHAIPKPNWDSGRTTRNTCPQAFGS